MPVNVYTPTKAPPPSSREFCAEFLRFVLSLGPNSIKKGKSYTYFSINNLVGLLFLGKLNEQFKEDREEIFQRFFALNLVDVEEISQG